LTYAGKCYVSMVERSEKRCRNKEHLSCKDAQPIYLRLLYYEEEGGAFVHEREKECAKHGKVCVRERK